MTLSIRSTVFFSLFAILAPAYAMADSVLGQLPTSPERIVSTVPPSGEGNPYGVAVVPGGFPTDGPLATGDILVANFNGSSGLQGTGTTIMNIAPGHKASVFFQGQQGLGLTTALGVLRAGFVLVGNVPTTDGTSATVQQGSLLVIDRFGNLVMSLVSASLLDGPWDLTINDQGSTAQVFVSNVLNGTVTRLNVFLGNGRFDLIGANQISHGFTFAPNDAAVVVGPTGLAYDPLIDVLYVASTADNEIFAIPFAGHTNKDVQKGLLIYADKAHLHGPLGLALAPNGHLITANGDAVFAGGTQNALVEFTTSGQFIAQYQVDPGPGGAAFGLAIANDVINFRFAAVNDNQNTLNIWVVQ
jgi:DNA-binding beta-propeller fold protein YncE